MIVNKSILKPTKYPRYYVSNDGKVYSDKRKCHDCGAYYRITAHTPTKSYSRLIISIEGKHTAVYVHRLVAEAFLPNPQGYPEINHKDGDKSNNDVNNLEWCTHGMNMWHRHGYSDYKTRPTRRNRLTIQDKFNSYIDEGVSIEAALYALC